MTKQAGAARRGFFAPFVLLAVSFLAAAFPVAAPLAADPWVAPGDARLRTDIELLQAAGYMLGPIDAWPLPWGQIDDGVARARADPALPPHLRLAVARIAALSAVMNADTHGEARAGATNEAALVRTFDHVARNRADASLLVSNDFGPVHVTLGGSWQSSGNKGRPATQYGNGFRPDGSYIAVEAVSNWVLYGGYVDHWWGAGQDGALLFSTSARPMPQIGFRRLRPYTIDLPVLRWLGPVSFEAFAGMAREHRRDFDDPIMAGMRLSFQPSRNFEIGFNRGLQLCGKGRPCGLSTIGHALVGFGDMDNTGTPNEPGNQLAGFDMSYRHLLTKSGHALKLSFATVAEDADNMLIEQFAHQYTLGFSGPVGHAGALYDAGFEYADTMASKLMPLLQGGRTWPGSVYNHFLYTDGWTFGRRPIGYALDGDARAYTLYGALTDSRNRRWNIALRSFALNRSNDPPYRISQNYEKIRQAEAGVNWPTPFGDVKMTARLQKNAPDTPTSSPLLLQGEIDWLTRF